MWRMKTQTQYFSDKLMSTYLFNPPKSLHPSAVWPCSAVRKVGLTMHSGTQRIDIHQHHHESSLYSQKLTKNICTIFCPLCVPKEGNKLLRADDSPLTAVLQSSVLQFVKERHQMLCPKPWHSAALHQQVLKETMKLYSLHGRDDIACGLFVVSFLRRRMCFVYFYIFLFLLTLNSEKCSDFVEQHGFYCLCGNWSCDGAGRGREDVSSGGCEYQLNKKKNKL